MHVGRVGLVGLLVGLMGCLNGLDGFAAESYYYEPDIGYSAVGLGLGFKGLNSNPSVIMGNPAGLRDSALGLTAFSQSFFQGDVIHLSMAGAFKLTPMMSVGASMSQLGTDGIAQTTLDDLNEIVQSGTFSYLNRKGVLATTFFPSSDLSFGLGLAGYDKHVGSVSGRGYNVDAGIMWQPNYQPFVLAFSWRNILNRAVSYSNGGSESLSTQWLITGEYRPPELPRLWLTGELVIEREPRFLIGKSIGAAYDLTTDHRFYVMGSLRDCIDLGKTRLIPSLGVVVEVGAIQVAYALQFRDPIADQFQHSVSITMQLPSEALLSASQPQATLPIRVPVVDSGPYESSRDPIIPISEPIVTQNEPVSRPELLMPVKLNSVTDSVANPARFRPKSVRSVQNIQSVTRGSYVTVRTETPVKNKTAHHSMPQKAVVGLAGVAAAGVAWSIWFRRP